MSPRSGRRLGERLDIPTFQAAQLNRFRLAGILGDVLRRTADGSQSQLRNLANFTEFARASALRPPSLGRSTPSSRQMRIPMTALGLFLGVLQAGSRVDEAYKVQQAAAENRFLSGDQRPVHGTAWSIVAM